MTPPVLNVLIITINLIVSGTVRILSTTTPPYYCHTFPLSTPSRECQPTSVSEHSTLASFLGHLPDQAQTAVRLMCAETFRECFCLQGVQSGDTVTTFS